MSAVFRFLFIAGVVLGSLQVLRLSEEPTPSAAPSSAAEDSCAVAAEVRDNRILISGEAADSLIIAVKVNGRLAAVTVGREGRFEAPPVPAVMGENEIEVFALTTTGRSHLLQRLTLTYGRPAPAFLTRNITRGLLGRRRIALTFDGGSGAQGAEEILDILKQNNIRCTLFLTGGFIRRHPQLVRRMAEEGHEIGNHTWSHPHLTTFAENRRHDTRAGITRERLLQELEKTAELFTQTTGRKMAPLWRAPFGEHNEEIRRWAAEAGYLQIGWTSDSNGTMDTLDWVTDSTSTAFQTADEILQRLLSFSSGNNTHADGGIVLMHLDSQRPNDPVYKILPAFIDSMKSRGYQFATVSELIQP